MLLGASSDPAKSDNEFESDDDDEDEDSEGSHHPTLDFQNAAPLNSCVTSEEGSPQKRRRRAVKASIQINFRGKLNIIISYLK